MQACARAHAKRNIHTTNPIRYLCSSSLFFLVAYNAEGAQTDRIALCTTTMAMRCMNCVALHLNSFLVSRSTRAGNRKKYTKKFAYNSRRERNSNINI